MRFDELLERAPTGTYVGVRFTAETVADLAEYQDRHSIPNPLDPTDFHTTVVYSRKSVHWRARDNLDLPVTPVRVETWDTRDGQRCLVILFDSPYLRERFDVARERGATYDYPEYKPHVTLSYDVGAFDASALPIPTFRIVLDHEYTSELNNDWKPTTSDD